MRDLKPLIAAVVPKIIRLRHQLHAKPELGYEEHETAKAVAAHIRDIPGIKLREGIAGTGIVAVFGHEKSGPCIALRADMDALPIEEQTGKDYSSTIPGKMHACGHDGHTACLVGAAFVLAQIQDELGGPVKLVFQPAEEWGAGAERMCQEGVLEEPDVAAIFGLHGWPELPVGHIAYGVGPVMASNDEFVIEVCGTGAHAALPHRGIDPILVASHIVVALQSIVARSTDPRESLVVTVGKIEGGTASNIIPERVSIVGTVRSFTPSSRDVAHQRIKTIAYKTAAAFDAKVEVSIEADYPVTVNHERSTAFAAEVFGDIVERHKIDTSLFPLLGSEDFSFYSQQIPGTFWGIGLRPIGLSESPACHSPHFDFNDEAIPLAIELHCELARRFAKNWE